MSQRLTELEHGRNVSGGSVQIDAESSTATGVLNSLDIAQSSNRLAALTIAETSLYHSLSLDPEVHFDTDPLQFIKGQIIVHACAAGIQAQGISYPLSIFLAQCDGFQLKQAIYLARNMGFKGAVCAHVSWAKICNEEFRPSNEELTYYQKVIEVFEEGLGRGLASAPLEGRMIDMPVYKRPQVF